MQTEATSENIASPKDFHISYYWQTLNSRIWWAIFYGGFAFVGGDGVAKAFHFRADGRLVIASLAMLVFVFLFTAIGSYLRSSEKYRKLAADKNQIAPIVGYKARWYHIGMFFLKLARNIILGILAGFIAMMIFGGIF